MGIFKLNGIDYMGGGGGGNTNYEELTQLEYDALTEEEKNNGTIYFITDANSNQDGKFQPIIYSEEEREIGVWTDGKPLYQKTLGIPSFPSTSPISIDVTSLNIDIMASAVGEAYAISNNTIIEALIFPSYASTSYYAATRFLNNTVQILHKGLNDYTRGIVTIQYTKTTDSPGSGQWTPQGVPAHHYSTEEQVVGTWVDGSTVYEKTLYVASGQINSSTILILPTQNNIERLINYEGSVYDTNDSRYYAIPYERQIAAEGIWVQCHVLSDHTLAPVVFTRQSGTYYLSDIYITIRYTKQSSSQGGN